MITPRTRSSALLAAGLLAVATLPAAAQDGPAVPTFSQDGTDLRRHSYRGDWQYFVGGGVAAFDCSGDADPDLYLAGGRDRAGLYRNDSKPRGKLKLTHLDSPVTDLKSVTGAYPLDIDSDGITDLVVLRVGETVLLRGLGDCTFERANETWSFDGGDDWTTAFAATWEGDAALPTLALGTYVDTASSDERVGNCGDNRLYRPNAAGTGYDAPIVLTPGFCALSMLFSDWGRTGGRDLRISNDRHYAPSGEEQLWRMTSGEPPTLYTEADGWQKLVIWGMGIASRDLTGDGRPEVYLTSQADNKLQTLVEGAAGPTYEDIALARGVNAPKPVVGDDPYPSTAWHPAFEDINNDGLVDLYVSKGNVEQQEGYALADPNTLLLQQADGTFTDVGEQSRIARLPGRHTNAVIRSRGAAVVDLNRDGLLDIVQMSRGPASAWRNLGSGTFRRPAPVGAFVALRVTQPAPNTDAIGAWVEVRAGDIIQTRELTVGGGHASGQLGWLQFGLGDAPDAEVRVTWPDGEVGEWQPVTANGWFAIERGVTEPVPVPDVAAPAG